MRSPAKKIRWMVLLMAAFLISSHVLAQEQAQGDQTSKAEQELSALVPDLADIVPLATELTGRLANLKSKVANVVDVSEVKGRLIEVETNLKSLSEQLQQLKDLKDYKYSKLVELKEQSKQEIGSLKKISNPIRGAIRQLGILRQNWLAEKKRWDNWHSSLLKEEKLDQLKPTFKKANTAIDTALDLVLPHLEAMLTLQEKTSKINAKINAFAVELDGFIVHKQRGDLEDASPPMLSSQYLSQFRSELWQSARKSLQEISWPGSRFLARKGWIIFIQGLLSLIVIIAVYRNRRVLLDSERWRFFAVRPLSSGLFLGFMATLPVYAYEGMPATWNLANTIVGWISFARLLGGLIEVSWKKQFAYGLIIVLIVNEFVVNVLSFPIQLFRLYTVLTALVGLLLCLHWAGKSDSLKEKRLYPWSLRLGSLFFAVIMILEIWGKGGVSSYLFMSFIGSTGMVLVFMLFLYMIHGGLEWLFRTSPLRRAVKLQSDEIDAIIPQVTHLIDAAIFGLILLPAILMTWDVYENLEEATRGLLAFGFNMGSQRMSVGLLIVSAVKSVRIWQRQ